MAIVAGRFLHLQMQACAGVSVSAGKVFVKVDA